MTDLEEFHQFISDTFQKLKSEKENESQILLFHEWQNSAHQDAIFIEVSESKNKKWILRFSKWKMGKDTRRLLYPIEKMRWHGNIKPSIITSECILSENENKNLKERITNMVIQDKKGIYKSLKINFNHSKHRFSWDEDKEIEDSIIELISELKNLINQ